VISFKHLAELLAPPEAPLFAKLASLLQQARRPRVLAYGGGLDSFGMLLDAVERNEMPDVCVFADVTDPQRLDPGEWPGTYSHIEEVVEPLCAAHGIELVTLDTNRYPVRDSRSLFSWLEERRQIPVAGPNRVCTIVAKVERFERWLDERFPARHNRYPLIERNLCRCRCQALVERLGFPVPRKSACTFCPFGSRGDWQTFAKELPDEFARTAALEANKPPTEAGKKLSIMGYRTLPDGSFQAPPLAEYIQKPYKPRKVPCAVCGRPQRATKATGLDWLPTASDQR
jgi:hypothetical protein